MREIPSKIAIQRRSSEIKLVAVAKLPDKPLVYQAEFFGELAL